MEGGFELGCKVWNTFALVNLTKTRVCFFNYKIFEKRIIYQAISLIHSKNIHNVHDCS